MSRETQAQYDEEYGEGVVDDPDALERAEMEAAGIRPSATAPERPIEGRVVPVFSTPATGMFSAYEEATLSIDPVADALRAEGIDYVLEPYDPRAAIRSIYSIDLPAVVQRLRPREGRRARPVGRRQGDERGPGRRDRRARRRRGTGYRLKGAQRPLPACDLARTAGHGKLSRMDVVAYIALGSNLGDRLAAFGEALRTISTLPGTHVLAVSQAYESEPAGVQAGHPPYANAVAKLRTGMQAMNLLGWLQDIEEQMGRRPVSDPARAATEPRTIDLDLLLYDEEEWDSEHLVLPHPRMKGRAFVMRPLAEVGPDMTWPDGSPLTRSQVLAAVAGPITSALGPIPGFEDETVMPDSVVLPGEPAGDWVELAMLPRFAPERNPDMDMLFVETVLGEAGSRTCGTRTAPPRASIRGASGPRCACSCPPPRRSMRRASSPR